MKLKSVKSHTSKKNLKTTKYPDKNSDIKAGSSLTCKKNIISEKLKDNSS